MMLNQINDTYGRRVTLCKNALSRDAYGVTCCRYLEINPVRAGSVVHAREYRWSSYHQRALVRLMIYSRTILGAQAWRWHPGIDSTSP